MRSPLEQAFAKLDDDFDNQRISPDEYSTRNAAIIAAADDNPFTTFGKSVVRSAINTVPSAMVGIGRATGADSLAETGEDWERSVNEAIQVNPNASDSIPANLGAGFGSLLGMAATGGVGGVAAKGLASAGARAFGASRLAAKAAKAKMPVDDALIERGREQIAKAGRVGSKMGGTGAGMTTGVGLSASEGARDYEAQMAEQGLPMDEEARQTAAQSTAPAGVLDYVLPNRLLKQGQELFRLSRADLLKKIADGSLDTAKQTKKMAAAKGLAEGAAIEGATEGAQQAWLNTVARAQYDYDRAIGDGVLEQAAYGAATGGLARAGMNAVQQNRFNRAYDGTAKQLQEAEAEQTEHVAREAKSAQEADAFAKADEYLQQSGYVVPTKEGLIAEGVPEADAEAQVAELQARWEATPPEVRELPTFDPTQSPKDYIEAHPEFAEAKNVGYEMVEDVADDGTVTKKRVLVKGKKGKKGEAGKKGGKKLNAEAVAAARKKLRQRYDAMVEAKEQQADQEQTQPEATQPETRRGPPIEGTDPIAPDDVGEGRLSPSTVDSLYRRYGVNLSDRDAVRAGLNNQEAASYRIQLRDRLDHAGIDSPLSVPADEQQRLGEAAYRAKQAGHKVETQWYGRRAEAEAAAQARGWAPEEALVLQRSGGGWRIIQPAPQPEAVQPEAVQPEAVQPEAVQPEAVQPEAVQPEAEQAQEPPGQPPGAAQSPLDVNDLGPLAGERRDARQQRVAETIDYEKTLPAINAAAARSKGKTFRPYSRQAAATKVRSAIEAYNRNPASVTPLQNAVLNAYRDNATDQWFALVRNSGVPTKHTPQQQASMGREIARRNTVLQKNNVGVTITDHAAPESVPADIRAKIRPGERPRAMLIGNQVHTFSFNLTGREDARRAVLHEVVGHLGVRGLYGNNEKAYHAALDKLYPALSDKALIDTIRSTYGSRIDLSKPDGKRLMVEEYIAHSAERMPEKDPGFFRKLWQTIRVQLRKWGVTQAKDAEIQDMLNASYAATFGNAAAAQDSYVQQTAKVRDMKRRQEETVPLNMRVVSTPDADSAMPGQERHIYENEGDMLGSAVAVNEKDGLFLTELDAADPYWAQVVFLEELNRAHQMGDEAVMVPHGGEQFDKWLQNNLGASIYTRADGSKWSRVNVDVAPSADPVTARWFNKLDNFALAPDAEPTTRVSDSKYEAFMRDTVVEGISRITHPRLKSWLTALNEHVNPTWSAVPHQEQTLHQRDFAMGGKDKFAKMGAALRKVGDKYLNKEGKEANDWFDRGMPEDETPSFLAPEDVAFLRRAREQMIILGERLVDFKERHKDIYGDRGLDRETFEKNKDLYAAILYADYVSNSTAGGKRLSKEEYYKSRKLNDEVAKAVIGEITNPFVRLGHSLETVGRDISINEYFEYLLEHPSLAMPKSVDELKDVSAPADAETGAPDINLTDALTKLENSGFLHSHAGKMEKKLTGKYTFQERRIRESADVRMQALRDEVWDATAGIRSTIEQTTGQRFSPDQKHEWLKVLREDYARVEGRKYGLLDGHFIRKELKDDIDEAMTPPDETDTALWKATKEWYNAWKKLKVPLNPISQIRNGFGNLGLMDLATPTNFATIARDVGAMFKSFYVDAKQYDVDIGEVVLDQKDRMQLARYIAGRYGAGATTFAAAELNADKATISKIAHAFSEANKLKSSAAKYMKFATIFTKYHDFMLHNYQQMEQIFKSVAVADYLRRATKQAGLESEIDLWNSLKGRVVVVDGKETSAQEELMGNAMDFANDAIFDYSKVSPFVNKARRSPIGLPFITFTLKSIPAVANAYLYRPQKMIKYHAIPALMAGMATGWDDEELERLERDRPDYMKKSGSMIMMPWKIDDKAVWNDASYLLPQGTFWNSLKALSSVNDAQNMTEAGMNAAGGLIAASGILSQPLWGTAIAVGTGENTFTKRRIFAEGATPGDKAMAIAGHTWDMMMPSLVSTTSPTRDALSFLSNGIIPEQVDARTGEAKRTLGQNVARAVGFNSQAVDPARARQWNQWAAKQKLDEARAEMRRKLRDKGNAGKRAEITLEYRERIQHLQERLKAA